MNKNDINTINIVKAYLQDNLYDEVRKIILNYLNENIETQIDLILKRNYRENSSEIIRWFFDDHDGLSAFILGIFSVILLVIIIVAGINIAHNLDIARLNEEARICLETGYGCKSNTKNTDIKYDNTPVIEINE